MRPSDRKIMIAVFLFLSAAGAPSVLWSDPLGKRLYENYCARCHGANGEGDGYMTTYLTVPVPSLAVLSRSNGNVFPASRVTEAIDGRSMQRTHGSPMPAWGFKLTKNMGVGVDDPDAETEAWIQAITRYLESIQK